MKGITHNGYHYIVGCIVKTPEVGTWVLDDDYDDILVYQVDQEYLNIGKECYPIIETNNPDIKL